MAAMEAAAYYWRLDERHVTIIISGTRRRT
jgi:hypothetical protein